MKPLDRRKVWVRSGGRCAVCGVYLLDGDIGSAEPNIGEAAHIKGKRRTGERNPDIPTKSRSPRHEYLLPGEDPDDPDNVMLLCPSHHPQIDATANLDAFDVDTLKTAKRQHERRIRVATKMVTRERTVVLRVIGNLYGNTVQCTRLEATGACLRTGDRFPDFVLAVDHATIECDLRGRPGERDGSDAYFADACRAIDELVDGRLRDGITRDHISHVSVFAFARLPLLVYLGSKLDDSFSTDIFQRSRRTQSWDWPVTTNDLDFVVETPEPARVDVLNVVVNVSGSIHPYELPEALQGLPTYTIRLAGDTPPHANVIESRATLDHFRSACYDVFAAIELHHKQARDIHLFAAIPLSAAVTIGQAINSQVLECVTVYHRAGSRYLPSLRIS